VLKPVDGYIALPEGPGLGLNVDEKAVRAAKGKQFPARTFRSLEEEGP
jgi:galactonate dehydratase